MITCTITALSPIHNTCSNGSTTVSGVGRFIASSDVPSIETVLRHCQGMLDRWKHHVTAYLECVHVKPLQGQGQVHKDKWTTTSGQRHAKGKAPIYVGTGSSRAVAKKKKSKKGT